MRARLTSLKNPRVVRAVRLRDRRPRERQGLFLIEGYRELRRAIERGLPFEELFICEELYLGENEPALVERAERECGAEVIPVTPQVFERIAYRDRPEGLLAVAPQPRWTLEGLPEGMGKIGV
ncbi:MAG: RNA methyltransferase substrate-binding domain-containing protein, partial [Planctomycetota bacterium]